MNKIDLGTINVKTEYENQVYMVHIIGVTDEQNKLMRNSMILSGKICGWSKQECITQLKERLALWRFTGKLHLV